MQRDSAIRINGSENFAIYLSGPPEENWRPPPSVVNSLGDNGIEIDPLVRDAAASVSAVT
jgi:hypothetical protein